MLDHCHISSMRNQNRLPYQPTINGMRNTNLHKPQGLDKYVQFEGVMPSS